VGAAWAITPVLVALAPAGMPQLETVTIDLRVLVFALALCIVTIVAFGAWPSLTMAATDPADALRDSRGHVRP
jgi:ABC-type lipoprotein release transport system permease subunit